MNESNIVSFEQEIDKISEIDNVSIFVKTLPHGDMLWRYVLTGEGRHQLDEINAFVDLNRILITLHALDNAPGFYKQLKMLGLYPQYQVCDYTLFIALKDLAERLLTDESLTLQQRKAYKQVYLRVLDIFYYMNDQNTFSDYDFFTQLVSEPKTQCLTEFEFYQRYSLESFGNKEHLPERLANKIKAWIKSFNGRDIDLSDDDFMEMERTFAETRLTYSQDFFEDGHRGGLILACFLLNRDRKKRINDDKTRWLRSYVERNLVNVIKAVLTKEDYVYDSKSELEPIFTWLTQKTPAGSLKKLLSTCENSLHKDGYITQNHLMFGNKQVRYQIFSNISRLLNLLIGCYWLEEVKGFSVASRLLQFSFALAPQRTIRTLSKLHRDGWTGGKFASHKCLKKFLKTLSKLKVPKCHIKAFEVCYLKEYDHAKYLWFIWGYRINVTWKEPKLTPTDTGLHYVNAPVRQQFYLDCDRIAKKKKFRPKQLNDGMLEVLNDHLCRHLATSVNCLINEYDEHDVHIHYEVYDEVSTLLGCPVLHDVQQVKSMHDEEDFVIVVKKNDAFNILVDNKRRALRPDAQHGHYGKVVIINDNINQQAIIDAAAALPNKLQRKELMLNHAHAYLAGNILFSEYKQNVGRYLYLKDYNWISNVAPSMRSDLVPFILSEYDLEKRYRFINLFCFQDNFNDSLPFEDICNELYLEQLLLDDIIDIEERWELEVDDFNDKYRKKHEEFKKELINTLTQMRVKTNDQ